MRETPSSSPVAAIVLAVAASTFVGCAECRQYNDCPDGSYCTDEGVCKELIPCEADGESEYFLNEGSLEEADHWTCVMPPADDPGAARVVDHSGPTTMVQGGSTRLYLDYEGPDLTGKTIIFGQRGEHTYHAWKVEDGSRNPLPMDLFMDQDAPGNENLVMTLAIDTGEGTAEEPKLGPLYDIPFKIIEVQKGDIQLSVTWDKDVDIDLFVQDPNGDVVYWNLPEIDSGGTLDLDSNAACQLPKHQNENVFWGLGRADVGTYRVWANLYSACEVTDPTYVRITRILRRQDIDVVEALVTPIEANSEFHPSLFGAKEPLMTFEF